ncbi:MAG: NAD(P)H-hydrate dehydratase [Chitinophagaceae bacterium]|nr:MAG: NAD(P)H-hydrate dehydratase [Chitinophagaceae bacterium]
MDKSSKGNVAITAMHTLSFECYKTALLVQENAAHVGEVHVLPIGLHPDYLQSLPATPQLLEEKRIRQIFRPRNRFAHKGSFGQALLVGGSWGKMGAMVLATKACLAAGAGLTTAFIPRCGYTVLQTTAPEAMALTDDGEEYLGTLPDDVERFSAIGIGPGMGTHAETQKLFSFLVRRYRRPLVIDADGLNILALNKDLLSQLPPGSILTPHPKEFDRLFGDHHSDFDRLQTAREKAAAFRVIIILKGHHSFLATQEGDFFNSTGNAGMAKGGSGDVLTGILTALLAQGYAPAEAAQLGVYLHGWAGDLAAQKFSMEAMLPSHLVDCLGEVFLQLNKKESMQE